MAASARPHHDEGMETKDRLDTRASQLLQEARRFQSAAAQPGSHVNAPEALASLEEALQALSGSWYQLAAGGSPRVTAVAGALPHEQEAHLTGKLHDVAAAFARCARVCREGRTEVTRIIARRTAVGRAARRRPSWAAGED